MSAMSKYEEKTTSHTPAERDKRGGPNTHHACTRTYSIYCIGRFTYGHTDNRGYAKIVSSCMDRTGVVTRYPCLYARGTGLGQDRDRGGDKVSMLGGQERGTVVVTRNYLC